MASAPSDSAAPEQERRSYLDAATFVKGSGDSSGVKRKRFVNKWRSSDAKAVDSCSHPRQPQWCSLMVQCGVQPQHGISYTGKELGEGSGIRQ